MEGRSGSNVLRPTCSTLANQRWYHSCTSDLTKDYKSTSRDIDPVFGFGEFDFTSFRGWHSGFPPHGDQVTKSQKLTPTSLSNPQNAFYRYTILLIWILLRLKPTEVKLGQRCGRVWELSKRLIYHGWHIRGLWDLICCIFSKSPKRIKNAAVFSCIYPGSIMKITGKISVKTGNRGQEVFLHWCWTLPCMVSLSRGLEAGTRWRCEELWFLAPESKTEDGDHNCVFTWNDFGAKSLSPRLNLCIDSNSIGYASSMILAVWSWSLFSWCFWWQSEQTFQAKVISSFRTCQRFPTLHLYLQNKPLWTQK